MGENSHLCVRLVWKHAFLARLDEHFDSLVDESRDCSRREGHASFPAARRVLGADSEDGPRVGGSPSASWGT